MQSGADRVDNVGGTAKEGTPCPRETQLPTRLARTGISLVADILICATLRLNFDTAPEVKWVWVI